MDTEPHYSGTTVSSNSSLGNSPPTWRYTSDDGATRSPLLLLDYKNRRWATDQVLVYLDVQDGLRLVLAALESGDRCFMQLADWLMDGDAPLPILPVNELLNEAVQLGCWEVAEGLIQRLRRIEKSMVDWDRTSPRTSQEESPFGRVMDAVTQSSLTFPIQTIAAKAAQGDVIAVRCLLDATVSNDTSAHGMTNREEATRMAFKAAAEARQLHVCDWLASNSYTLRYILPLDRDLQAVFCFQGFGRGCSYLCATAEYGFEEQLVRDNDNIGSALLGHFARHGDLKMLKKLETRWMLDTVHVLECAVEGRQLAVVEWILNTLPCSLGVQMEHGVLAMQTRCDTSRMLGKVLRQAARHGHLHETGMLLEAVKTSELGVVQFLHEDCNVRLATWPLPEFVESASVDFVAYFLDMLVPQGVDGSHLLGIAAAQANRDVVEYLVLHRGFWYPHALARAVYRGSTNQSTASVEIGRILYSPRANLSP